MNQREQLEQAIAAMESLRAEQGDAVVDAAIGAFREKLASLDADVARMEQRQVTVLFAEVTGISEMAAVRDPDEMREITGQLWTRMKAILAHAEGITGKQSGNGIMAFFGAQPAGKEPRVDHPERAVRAALEMLAETRRFTASQGLEQVSLRTGLNSGPVLLHATGALHEPSDPGDTVRLAGQLQKAGDPGDVLVSASTYQLVRGIFNIQTLDPILGKVRILPAYRVLSVRPRALSVTQQLLGSASAMVGREMQLHALQESFQAALDTRELRTVTLSGEAGLGKTRLVNEFVRRIDRSDRPFILFRGRPSSGPTCLPYAIIHDLLSYRFKILASDPPATAREKLVRGVESWLGADSIEAAHWIGHLAGYNFSDSPFLIGRLDDARYARQAAFQSLNRFLFAVAVHTPLVILVDDLQRADDGSLDWLESLMRAEPRGDKKPRTGSLGRATNGPVLLLCVTLPDLFSRRPEWKNIGASHATLMLDPLSDADTAGLARLLMRSMTGGLQPYGSVEWLVEQIKSRANGSPLFIEQVVQGFLDSGVLLSTDMQDGGGRYWRVDTSALVGVRFPARLDEVIRSRLDNLPPVERQVLEQAAVIGQVFWETALHMLMDSTGYSDVDQALHNLQARGLINRRDTSAFDHSEEYRFKNALLCQIAYEMMPEQARRAAHARVAGWLAAQSGEQVTLYTGAIAGHFERAEDYVQASGWYILAAQQARRASAPEVAVDFYRRALDLLSPEIEPFSRRLQIFKSLWDVQWWQAHFQDALATGSALLKEAEARQDLAAQASAWNRIAAVQNRQGDAQAALRSVQRAERLARSAGDSSEVVLALFNRGLTLFQLGDSNAALEAGEEALAYNQAILGQTASGEPGLVTLSREGRKADPAAQQSAERDGSRILSLLAMIHQRAGRYELAAEDYRQVLAICRIQNDQNGMIGAYNNLGVTAYLRGDYRASAGYYQEALHLSARQGYTQLRLVCLSNLATAQVELGENAQAETALSEVLSRIPENGSPQNNRLLADVYRSLAQACLGQGRSAEALAAGLHALNLARLCGLRQDEGRDWRILGRIAAQGAQPVIDDCPCDAHACYAASMQLFVELGEAAEQARTARDWAQFEMAQGDPHEGARLWQESIDLFSRLGLHNEVEHMNQKRGDVA